MNSNTVRLLESFQKHATKLYKQNSKLEKKVETAVIKLGNNPFDPALKSHKVNSRKYGTKWSSRVTGDIRIIWDFGKAKQPIIIAFDIGGHSGKSKVYN